MSQSSTATPQNITTRNADSEPASLGKNGRIGDFQNTKKTSIKFVYQLPRDNKVKLLNILREESKKNSNLWQELASVFKIKPDQVEVIRQETLSSMISSPFDDILTILGDQQRSINELYAALYRLKQFSAMETIKPYVGESLIEKINEKIKAKPAPAQAQALPNLSLLLKDSLTINDISIPNVFDSLSNQDTKSSEASIKSDMNIEELKFGIPEVPYDELTLATNNWNESNTLGRGGFGTVFKGNWKNTLVAIKRIEPRDKKVASDDYKTELKQSLNELKYLNACRHDNILGLYGYCLTGENPCLVYQLMPNGTVEQHLFKQEKTLKWEQKYFIALGTARGLQFLHTFKDKPLIHGDIKPANILLDFCFTPKIGDFGLARESPSQKPVEISKAYGTRPYLPHEFITTRQLSTKIDTFSFGIVLYELATRKRVLVKNRTPEHLIDLMKLLFEQKIKLENVIDVAHPVDQLAIKIFSALTLMGKDCTSFNAEERPEMVNVLKRLELV